MPAAAAARPTQRFIARFPSPFHLRSNLKPPAHL
jgi:hypothetical protein